VLPAVAGRVLLPPAVPPEAADEPEGDAPPAEPPLVEEPAPAMATPMLSAAAMAMRVLFIEVDLLFGWGLLAGKRAGLKSTRQCVSGL
jgi:hypothetical protein